MKTIEKLTVTEIDVEKLIPNRWNPNRMSPEMQAKLKAYLQREGFVEPLVVRPHDENYQILGGYHRRRIAKELGYDSVPCVVVDLDDRRAKILSVNLNELKGQSLPKLLADLVHDLTKEITIEDLESQLPYSVAELKDSLALLKVPDGLNAMLEEEVERQKQQQPTILTFVVENGDVVEHAIELAKRESGAATRGRALEHIAKDYLEHHG